MTVNCDLPYDRIEEFHIGHYHYGDVQMITNVIYNLAVRDKFVGKVHFANNNIGQHIMTIFDYSGYIELVSHVDKAKHGLQFNRILNLTGNLARHLWCSINVGYSSFFFEPLKSFVLPKTRIPMLEKNNLTCFQFDNRSAGGSKVGLNFDEMCRAVSLFGDEKSIAVGGHGSRHYFPERLTHYASLYDQAKFLLRAKSFFGVDSGMSHLAGTLGVDGDIIMQATCPIHFDSLKFGYNFMYPSFRIHRRDSISAMPKKIIKLA